MAVPATEYHDRTKHSPASIRESGYRLDFENKPLPYKVYLERPSQPLADSIRPPQQSALAAVAERAADPLAGTGADRAPPDASLDRDLLTQLCYLTGGITKRLDESPVDLDPETTPREQFLHAVQSLYHAASCTGKLYHVDCYLVCGASAGVQAGVYHFDPLTCSLDVLREGDFRGVLAAAAGSTAVDDAPLTVVTASTWWRNAWKYRDRTFRHAFWDSGTMLANLLAVAHGLDRRAEVVTVFADVPVADLLGIDPTEEAPLELVPIGQGAPASEPRTVPELDPETRPLSPDPVDYPLVHEAWTAGVLDDGDAADAWRDGRGSGPVGTRDPGGGEPVPLDPASHEDATRRSIFRTIRRRGSCRQFRRDPVPFETISTVLDRATRGAPLDVCEADGPPLQFTDCYLIAADVEGLADGAYHYHPGAGELEQLRAGTFRREAGHLALDQSLGADAALNVYFLADLAAVTGRLGDRGYRVAQLEAAITAGRLYLATYAHDDLGGTGLTFYDDVVTDFFAPRATGQTPMFLYTLGRPA